MYLCAKIINPILQLALLSADMELKLINDISQLSLIGTFLDQLAEKCSAIAPLRFNLDLVMDEAFSNIASYAYPGKTDQPILLKADFDDKALTFTFIDEGIPFDPTQIRDADVNQSVEDRPIGGLGIFLIRNYMDEYKYQRQDNKNVQTLVKYLTQSE